MLTLPKRTSMLNGINARIQRHGEEPAPAMDIFLDLMLSPQETIAVTGEKLIVESWFNSAANALPEPLLKDFKPYKRSGKFENSAAIFTLGINQVKVEIKEATLAGQEFQPVTGGMTKFGIKVQALITNKNNELFLWMGREVEVELHLGSLVDAESQKDLDLQQAEEKPLNTHGDGEEPVMSGMGREIQRSAKRRKVKGEDAGQVLQ